MVEPEKRDPGILALGWGTIAMVVGGTFVDFGCILFAYVIPLALWGMYGDDSGGEYP